jgi:hypothetical protein
MAAETTERNQARSIVFGEVPPENIIRERYDFFLPDAFGNLRIRETSILEFRFPGDPNIAPEFIDGFRNDDSYRASRHFGRNIDALSRNPLGTLDKIRTENSLARTLDEKKDQPAVIRLLARRGGAARRTDRLTSLIPPNTKFFLQNVVEPKEEKVQVIETFGEFIAYFFGRRPEFYTFSGTLLNARNHDWKNEWHINYDEFLRGTKAAERRAFVYIQYDDVVVEGFMLNCQTQMVSLDDKAVPFSFQMLVTNRQPVNRINLLRTREIRSGLSELERGLLRTLEDAADFARKSGLPEDTAMFAIIRDFVAIGRLAAAGIIETPRDPGDGKKPLVSGGTRSTGRPGDPSFQDDAREAIMESNKRAEEKRLAEEENRSSMTTNDPQGVTDRLSGTSRRPNL